MYVCVHIYIYIHTYINIRFTILVQFSLSSLIPIYSLNSAQVWPLLKNLF